ncbi:hypothetical protein [Algoriphagus sp. Y33]|nr:hypothetical protein [Algoriphagus sp. Y33]
MGATGLEKHKKLIIIRNDASSMIFFGLLAGRLLPDGRRERQVTRHGGQA